MEAAHQREVIVHAESRVGLAVLVPKEDGGTAQGPPVGGVAPVADDDVLVRMLRSQLVEVRIRYRIARLATGHAAYPERPEAACRERSPVARRGRLAPVSNAVARAGGRSRTGIVSG